MESTRRFSGSSNTPRHHSTTSSTALLLPLRRRLVNTKVGWGEGRLCTGRDESQLFLADVPLVGSKRLRDQAIQLRPGSDPATSASPAPLRRQGHTSLQPSSVRSMQRKASRPAWPLRPAASRCLVLATK